MNGIEGVQGLQILGGGTQLLADLFPGSTSSDVANLTSFAGYYYFSANGAAVLSDGKK